MKRFFQACVVIATTSPFLLSGFAANATALPLPTEHGAEALRSAAKPVNLSSNGMFELGGTLKVGSSPKPVIQTREDFLVSKNCLRTNSANLEIGIPLTCQARVITVSKDVGGENLILNDISDRDGLKLDLVLTHHRLEAGSSKGLGIRFRL